MRAVRPSPSASDQTSSGPLYHAVWRWHFYAGLFVAPFALFLALTGAIYLWKPQYEAWRYQEMLIVPGWSKTTVPLDVQLAAARAAAPPGWRAQTFQPSFAAGQTALVVFKPPANAKGFGSGLSIRVDPYTGGVVGQLHDDETLMATVKKLHSSLLAGNTGRYVVELAASWALVLFVTGLYLAWPRPRFDPWGFLLPRLEAKGRILWRDLHAVPAVWLSFATIFLLSSGLLWTQGAGGWYRKISAAIGQDTPRESNAGAHRSELTGWSPPLKAGVAEQVDRLASAPPRAADPQGSSTHVHGTDSSSANLLPESPVEHAITLEHVAAIALEHRVPHPFVIALPVGPQGVFSVISDREQPFKRAYLHLDQYSGKVLADVRFKDFGYLAQFFSWGIVAHEGRLFGLANQILGTLAAAGVMLLSVSGVVLWWKRRPAGRFAAPVANPPLPRAVFVGTLALAALLPLLAASLVIICVVDRLVARRNQPACPSTLRP
jgi:uncharacterized iron-regulated membrane protein